MIPFAPLSIRRLLVGAAVLSTALTGLVASPVEARMPTAAPARAAAPCTSASYLWSHLSRCGWPGPDNTGPRTARCPGGRLAVRGSGYTDVIRVRKAGATVACQSIKGCLSIEAPNVTVRDVAVACSSGRSGEAANGTGVIKVENGASADIRRVRLNGRSAVHACVWNQGTRLTVAAMNCRGVDDGFFSWADTSFSNTTGDNFRLVNSYLHSFTTRTANGHVDGFQTEGARHGLIRHNTFLMTSDDDNATTSAIAIWNGIRSSSDIQVSRNLIAGGGFSVYAEDYSPSEASPAGGNSVTDISITDNVFSTRLFGCVGFYGVWFPRGSPTDGWSRTGNRVWETGQRIDNRNPTFQGRTCT